jgi:hypothetical protein
MKRHRPRHIILSALIWKSQDNWIIQTVEHDFAAHGPTKDAALAALKQVILGHLHITKGWKREDPLADVPPAPEALWEKWESAEKGAVEELIPAEAGVIPAYIARATMDSGGDCHQ